MVKKFWIVALSLVLVFALAACGTASPQNNNISGINESSHYEGCRRHTDKNGIFLRKKQLQENMKSAILATGTPDRI